MDIYAAIEARRSVRSYQDQAVPDEVLNRVLEAARWAPSARNMQPWKLVVVSDQQRRRDLSVAASEQYFLYSAPLILAAVALRAFIWAVRSETNVSKPNERCSSCWAKSNSSRAPPSLTNSPRLLL